MSFIKTKGKSTCNIKSKLVKKEYCVFKNYDDTIKSISDLINILFKYIINCLFKMFVDDVNTFRYIIAIIIQVFLLATFKLIKRRISKRKFKRRYLWNI